MTSFMTFYEPINVSSTEKTSVSSVVSYFFPSFLALPGFMVLEDIGMGAPGRHALHLVSDPLPEDAS